MKDLLIVGAGGFGRELLQWSKEINERTPRWNIRGFLDDDLHALDGYDCNYEILGKISEWQPNDNEEFVIALGFPEVKKRVITSLLERGADIVSLIHPDAHVGSFCKIGKGCIIYPDTRITVNVTIGDYVTILAQNFVGHDVRIGSYSTVFGSCSINGYVEIGESVLLNNSASTVPNIKIGDGAVIGAGSVVISNVKPGRHMFGNPAKRL